MGALRIDNLESKKVIDPNANIADLINNGRHTIANKQQNNQITKTTSNKKNKHTMMILKQRWNH